MATELRVGSLNLRAMPRPDRGHIDRLAKIIAAKKCDVVLLQECLRAWLDPVCETAALTGFHAHTVPPHTEAGAFPPDGCAIAVSDKVKVGACRRIPSEQFMPDAVQRGIYEEPPAGFQPMPQRLADRYSARSIMAELTVADESLVVGSFHGTPGSGHVGGKPVREWKPFFPGAVALELSRIQSPFIFGIDANEPRSESLDTITFHWAEGRSGVKKAEALLGRQPIHRGRDLFREWLRATGAAPQSDEVLLATYAPSPAFQRRFDSIWATPELELIRFETHLDEVVAAGGDHAMLVADLRFR